MSCINIVNWSDTAALRQPVGWPWLLCGSLAQAECLLRQTDLRVPIRATFCSRSPHAVRHYPGITPCLAQANCRFRYPRIWILFLSRMIPHWKSSGSLRSKTACVKRAQPIGTLISYKVRWTVNCSHWRTGWYLIRTEPCDEVTSELHRRDTKKQFSILTSH
jgi:hypothetical protein